MTTWNPEANDRFLQALELRSPGERRAYLDQACGGDPALRLRKSARKSVRIARRCGGELRKKYTQAQLSA